MSNSEHNSVVKYHGVLDSTWIEHVNTFSFQEDKYKSSSRRKVVPINWDITPAGPGKHTRVRARVDLRIQKFLVKFLKTCYTVGLVLKYQPDGRISKHRDGNGYGPVAVSVSSTDYFLGLQQEDGTETVYHVGANQVISFPSKLVHWAWHETNDERLVILGWSYSSWSAINK